MKKLMIAAAIVCAAAISQAASVTWSAANVMDGEKKANGWLAYAFLSNVSDANSTLYLPLVIAPNDALDLIKGGDALVIHDYQVNWEPVTVQNGEVNFTEDMQYDPFIGKDDTVSGYLIVLNSDSLDTATGYIMTDPTSVTFAKDDSVMTIAAGDLSSMSFTPLSADIPEPTSAMLMLLGAAGLALRRKRA